MGQRPTKAERDEGVEIDVDPDELVEAIPETGPPEAGKGVTQEAADSAGQPEADGTNEG